MPATTYFQFRSRSVVQYTQIEFDRSNNYSRSFLQLRSAEDLAKQSEDKLTYSGELRQGAKKRLTKAIENLVMLARPKEHTFISKRSGQTRTIKFDLNFITLTVHSPDRMIRGKEGHKVLLEPFLLWLRREYGLELYIWKAELQSKTRLQLHYHITTDVFIPLEDIWLKWGELNDKAGYLNEWWKKRPRTKITSQGEILPNYPVAGTDVHSVYKVKNTAGYLKKCIFANYDIRAEMAKDNEDKISIEGKVWDCSLVLKSAQYYKTTGDSGTEKYILQAEKRGEAQKTFADEHCTIYQFKKPARFVMSEYDKFCYQEHLSSARRYQRKKPVKKIKLSDTELRDIQETLAELYPVKEVKHQLPPKPDLKRFDIRAWPTLFNSS